jgi:hypothetical protein
VLEIRQLKRREQLVVARISGLAHVTAGEALVAALAEDTLRHRDRRLLLDARGIVGALAPYEHRQLGLLMARRLSHLHKLALCVPRGKAMQALEQSGSAAGLPVRAFVSTQEAIAWLA